MPDSHAPETCHVKSKCHTLIWSTTIVFIVLADQISKWWVVQNIQPGEMVEMFPGLNLTLAHNHGIAFGFFSQSQLISRSILLFFALIITSFVGIWLYRTPRDQKQVRVALVCILGGALGNIIDRFMHGYVIDFVDAYIKNWHWWTFNVADVFISLGALILFKNILFDDEKKEKVK